MCVNGPRSDDDECYPTQNLGLDKLQALFVTNDMDQSTVSQIYQLLTPAHAMQNRIFPPLIAGAFACFLASVLLSAVRQNMLTHPEPKAIWMSKHTVAAIGSLGVLAFGFASASAVMTTQVSRALAWWMNDVDPASSGIRVIQGVSMQVLQWMIVGMIILYHLCFAHIFTDPKKKKDAEKGDA